MLDLIKECATVPEVVALGFYVTRFSTDEVMIMVNKDNSLKLVVENGSGKVYSTKDNKEVLHEVFVPVVGYVKVNLALAQSRV